MLKNKFELPQLIFLPVIEDIIERLNIFPNVTAKKFYLDREINNYHIEEALKMWDNDCAECVRQGYENGAFWLGIFNAFFGHNENPFDKQFDRADPDKFEDYNLGQQTYSDYIRLCELRDNLTSEVIKAPDKLNLASIFNENNNSFEVCKELMEDIELTIDGKPNYHILTPGRVGKLTGLISAIKETPGMLKLDNPSDELLLKYFNAYLNTDYTTFSKISKDYKSTLPDAKRYMKRRVQK